MNKLLWIRKQMDKSLGWICTVLFMILVVIGAYQIIVRYFFQNPSTRSEELLTYGFTWLSLLAAAYVFGKRDHMRMSFLLDRTKGTLFKGLHLFGEVLVLLFSAIVMVYGGYEIVELTLSQKTASLGVSMGVIYLAVLISGVITVLYSILNIIQLLLDEGER